MRKYVTAGSLNFVFVTRDAAGLAALIKSGKPSPITYASPKPPEVTADDAVIEKEGLPLAVDHVRVVKAAEVMR